MTLKIIGAGFGRTGTKSLKLALEQLGFGPCHHMEEVMTDLMFEMPSKTGIQRIVITEESVTLGSEPKVFLSDDEGARQA